MRLRELSFVGTPMFMKLGRILIATLCKTLRCIYKNLKPDLVLTGLLSLVTLSKFVEILSHTC